MIFTKKAGIRLQTNKSLTDVGDFFIIGSQICNKSLQASIQATADKNGTGFAFNVFGNQHSLNFLTNDAVPRPTVFNKGILRPYFDSTQGITAGNRYVACAADVVNSSELNVAKVLSDGSLEPFYIGTLAPNEGRAVIFAESATLFYIVTVPSGAAEALSPVGGITIIKMDKSSKTCTVLLSATTGGSVAYSSNNNYIYEGIYNGHAVFSFCSKLKCFDNSNTGSTEVGYVLINLAGGTATKVGASVWTGAQGTVSTCHTVLMPHPSDATKQCFYVCGSKGTGAVALTDILSLYKTTVNANIQAIDTVTTANFAPMTLANTPSDFVYGLSNYTNLLVLETYGFTNNGTNYIVVVKHSKNIPTTPSNYTNKMWLLKVENDGVTATFIQNITLPQEFTDVIASNDGKTIICAKANNGFIAYRFDSGSAQMIASEYYGRSGLRKIAIDNTNTIFMTYDDVTAPVNRSLDIISMNNSGVLIASFQGNPTALQYTGTPIVVNVLISAYDMFGARLVRNINVYAEGCTFQENGATAMAYTTSATDDLVIPIVIAGPGAINVTPDFA